MSKTKDSFGRFGKSSGSDWTDASRHNRCVICGSDSWCQIARDGTTVLCKRVSNGGPPRVNAMGVEYWQHSLRDDQGWPVQPPSRPSGGGAERAGPDVLDDVYRALLGRLGLSATHAADLARRGLTGAAIEAAGYATLPVRGRAAHARALLERFGEVTCQGVPGLCVKTGVLGSYWTVAGYAGILVPVRDADGRIVALKTRADDAADAGGKYRYLSSSAHGGPKADPAIHCPVTGAGAVGTIRVTEGELKADVLNALAEGVDQTYTLSVPGAGAWAKVTGLIKERWPDANVRVAYDADWRANDDVYRALQRVTTALVDAFGRDRVRVETWPPESGKGLDDVAAAGKFGDVVVDMPDAFLMVDEPPPLPPTPAAEPSAPSDPADRDPPGDWTKRLRRKWNRDQNREVNQSWTWNVSLILQHHGAFAGMLRYNRLTRKTETTRETPWGTGPGTWTDRDDTELSIWLQAPKLDINMSPEKIAPIVESVAHATSYHPVQDYLNHLTWDGTARLDTWLKDYLGATASDEYLAAVGTWALMGAVARAFEPGCKNDYVFVLEGPQGIGKSAAFRALMHDLKWVAEHQAEAGTKDAAQVMEGKWCLEFDEVDRLTARDQAVLKGFITRVDDYYRNSYGRLPGDHPRPSFLVGTCNKREWLTDETGNRRWWPVAVTEIKLDALRAVRDQLWAEAVHRYRAGERRFPTLAEDHAWFEREQESRRTVDPWQDAIGAWLDSRANGTIVVKVDGKNTDIPVREHGLVTTDVLEFVTLRALAPGQSPKPFSAWTHADLTRVGRCVSAHGWQQRQVRDGTERGKDGKKKQTRRWFPPA